MLLVGPVGRAIGTQQKLGTALGEVVRHRLVPDVLTDRHADGDALDVQRLGQRPGLEIALLVEHIVIGQFALETARNDLAILGKQYCIVERMTLAPDRRDDQADGTARRCGDERVGRIDGVDHKPRPKEQVLREVAGEEQLGQHQDVGTRRVGLRQRLAGELQIAREIPDFGIELGKCDAKVVDHGDIREELEARKRLAAHPGQGKRRDVRRPMPWVRSGRSVRP